MVTQINELRVVMDTSSYDAGAAKVEKGSAAAAAAAEKLTASINGVKQADSKLSDAGGWIEKLKGRTIDGYAAMARLNSETTKIARAFELGKLSSDQMSAALDGAIRRAGQMADVSQLLAKGQTEAARAAELANQRFQQQRNLMPANTNIRQASAFNTSNIAAQFQDIAVTASMGMNPLQIALQQGTQLSMALGEAGAAGAVRSLGAAFLSLLNPVSLMAVGFTAAAAAAIQYLGPLVMQGDQANEKLAQQRDLIAEVAQKWGAAMPALKAYNDERQRAEDLSKQREAVSAAVDLTWTGARDTVRDFNVQVTDAIERLKAAGAESSDILDVQRTWDNLLKRIQSGKATFEDVRASQTTLNLVMNQNSQAIDGMSAAWGRLLNIINEASGRSKRLVSDLTDPFAQYQEQLKQGQPYTDAMLKLQEYYHSLYNPDNVPAGMKIPIPTQRPSSQFPAIDSQADAAGSSASEADKAAAALHRLQLTQNEELEKLRLEASLVGASAAERARQTAALQAEQQLRQQGISTLTQEGQAYIANAKAMADARTEIERQNAAYQSVQQTGSSMIDSLVTGTGTLKDRLKAVADQLLQWVETMAIANPLKNALFGTNLPTLADLFSGKPAIPANNNTSTPLMNVTASVVNLSGQPLGGFPAAPGGAQPTPGSLGDLIGYKAANNNVAPTLRADGLVNVPPASNTAAVTASAPTTDVAAYIRQAAIARGIDPNTALAVARSEGGLTSWNQQSRFTMANGMREPSYGPYQLYMNGGLGNDFQRQTGLDPRLAQNGPQGVDFALDYASKNGWTAFHGAANTGISKWQGIGQTPGVDPQTTNSVNQNLTKMSANLASTSKDVSLLGDNSMDAGKSIMDAFKTPATPSAPGGFPAAPMSNSYFPPAPAPAFNPLMFLKSIPILGNIFSLFGFADGTDFAPGGMAMVGERGPELLRMPRGASITPNHKLNQVSNDNGGGGRMKVDVGVTVDQNGNLQAYVKNISRSEASAVAADHSAAAIAAYRRDGFAADMDHYRAYPAERG